MGKKEGKRGSGKGITIYVVILLIIILGSGGYLGYRIYNANKDRTEETSAEATEEVVDERTVQIFQGDDRPVAVMIDNHKDAWAQSGLNDAYMIYEIIVEGSETRLMALFKGKDTNIIGPVRSARHYFLDYALENDALYGHIGWSPQAEDDIDELGVNNINGLIYDSGKERTEDSVYWRSSQRSAPHNCYTSINGLKSTAETLGFTTKSIQKSVLHYVVDEVELGDTATVANAVNIPFSYLQNVRFEYNPETKRYTRFARGVMQTDASTGEPLTTKNIIVQFVSNYTLSDTENKGRQGIENIGTVDGYYITNGKAIKITCEKTAREAQTIYRDEAGNEIDVNDGNTYVEICPLNADVTFE